MKITAKKMSLPLIREHVAGILHLIMYPVAATVLLLAFIGPRLELVGLFLGLLLLSVRKWQPVSAVGAALAAIGFGFRVRFVTDPTGGYFFLNWISIPLTLGWILFIIWTREALRRGFPQRGIQLAIDMILVLTALLLGLASPQTRTLPVAFYIPIVSLFLIALELKRALNDASIKEDHSAIAFMLALFGISGAMKGAVSISLIGPLATLGFPLFATAQLKFMIGGADEIVFSSHRFSITGFLVTSLLVSSAFTIAAVGFAKSTPAYAIVPVALTLGLLVFQRVGSGSKRSRLIVPEGERFAFGIRFAAISLDDAVVRVERMLREKGNGRFVVTPNSASIIKAEMEPALLTAYEQADLVLPDGIGVVWASRLLGIPIPMRVTGVDLVERVLSRAGASGTRVFLLGGRPGVAARAAARLKARYPDLIIVGIHHGYFHNDDKVINTIAAANPDLVLVGMGVPRQELFMLTARAKLTGVVMIGVGGALDLFAGDCRRAPEIWQRLGLEWLYRLIQNPRRIAEVIMVFRFAIRVLLLWVSLLSRRLALQED